MSRAQEGREPRTNLRRTYETCLAARRQWRSVRGKTADATVREEAHGDLHEAVMSWFEALVPYISERPGEVKQLWESAPLYPMRQQTIKVYKCGSEQCGFAAPKESDDHDLGAGDACPACGMPLEPGEVLDTDDEGRPLYEWACGLKRLANWSSATEKERVSRGKWSTDDEVIEVPKRLDPDVLLRAARYLDLAAEECGLLEDTDRALETGDLG